MQTQTSRQTFSKSLELRLTVLLFSVSQDRNSFALMQTHCPGIEENGCHRTTVPPSHHRHQQLQFILLNTTISNSHLIWLYCSIISFSSSPSWNYQCKTSLIIPRCSLRPNIYENIIFFYALLLPSPSHL
jgi:hypothetical protein